MQISVNSAESLNSPVYAAPPCICLPSFMALRWADCLIVVCVLKQISVVSSSSSVITPTQAAHMKTYITYEIPAYNSRKPSRTQSTNYIRYKYLHGDP